jgi:hypothetical protein
LGQLSVRGGTGNSYFNFPIWGGNSPGLVALSDWSLLPAVLTGDGAGNAGAARIVAPTGTISSLTITNYELFLEWGWDANRLRAGTVQVGAAGKIRHVRNTDTAAPWAENAGVFIECQDFLINAGGQIDVDGCGYRGGENDSILARGPGAGPYSSYRSGAGGGHGGSGGGGGGSGGGSTYDSSSNPTNVGSGGGGGANTGGGGGMSPGGSGGGYVKIVAAGTLTINGNGITARGRDSVCTATAYNPGGGSGGGINILCRRFAGSGPINASGGHATGTAVSGGGGGGRIAIYVWEAPYYTSKILTTNVSASGGFGYALGSNGVPGTIYRQFSKPRGTMFSSW